MKLDISHDAGVGVGKGEVADVGAVLLRQIVRMDVPALAAGKGPLDDLTQLQVEGDDDHAVEPGPEACPVRVRPRHN